MAQARFFPISPAIALTIAVVAAAVLIGLMVPAHSASVGSHRTAPSRPASTVPDITGAAVEVDAAGYYNLFAEGRFIATLPGAEGE